MNTVEFDYAIGQQVTVGALGLKGRISGMTVDECGHSYRVVYWSDGCRKSEWMFAWEIEGHG